MLKKIDKKHQNMILLITAIFLTLLYLMSFITSTAGKDSREKIKTSLINPKYKDSITSFELSDSSGNLELVNNGSFWTAGSLTASKERIQNFIENLTSIRNLYKISDKITENSSFGLNNGTEFHLRYYTDSGFHELVFGNQDFALSSRYLMTEKSSQVYETDSSLDAYLTSSLQSWAEPYLISRTASVSRDIQSTTVIFSNPQENGGKKTAIISDINKFLELRHGGGVDEAEYEVLKNQKASMEIFIENGDKSSIKLEIYPSENQDISYIVKAEYYKQQGISESKSPYYTSYSKISSWTYNKIKEITL